ncbi:uncharacterized protein LOC144883371 isoform X3 [Branchiostoma floridae x Branchiostoma japonicum]
MEATSQGSFHATRAFAVIGPLLLVSGVALVYYAEHKNSNKDKRKYGVLIIAGDISDLTAAFHFTRAFAVIGPLLLVAGVNVALVFYAEHKNSNKVQRKYGALIIAGGACGVIATAIFGVELRNAIGVELSIPFGYSFHLTLVQGLLTLGGGAAIIADGRRDAEDQQPVQREEVTAMREPII